MIRAFIIVLLGLCIFTFGYAQECPYALKTKIFFEVDQSEISLEAQSELAQFIDSIQGLAFCSIEITASTDSTGNIEYNQRLSEERANSVSDYIRSRGLSLSGLSLKPTGETKAESNTESDLWQDRNATVTVSFPMPIDSLRDYFIVYGFVTKLEDSKPIGASVSEVGTSGSVYLADSFTGYYTALIRRKYKVTLYAEYGDIMATKSFISTGFRSVDSIRADIQLDLPKIKFEGKSVEPGQKIAFDKIYFEPNKAEFTAGSEIELERLYQFLDSNPDISVEVGGHINLPGVPPEFMGSEMYNLSVNRAKAVVLELVEMGIERNRLSFKGYGNHSMLYPYPKDDYERQMNRRVEVTVLLD